MLKQTEQQTFEVFREHILFLYTHSINDPRKLFNFTLKLYIK